MYAFNSATVSWMQSLPNSELSRILSLMPRDKAAAAIVALKEHNSQQQFDERDRDIERKRDDRAESCRIIIPACVDPQRRERALQDPELFLRGTYLAARYKRPFGKLHFAIIDALLEVAKNGGKQAIAAPRGRGKTEIVKGMLLFLICSGLVRFPIPIGQTTRDAEKIYKDFRKKIMLNDLLAEDFPEICYPVRALEGAPQRSAKQHIDGQLTGIVWTNEALRFATVPEQYRGPIDYGLVNMEFRGLDAAIRGVNTDGARPDFIIIDDPETRESAKSDSQIIDRTNALEQDIVGLAGEDEELAQVMLTTIQNRKCISFQYTDPDQKPSWMGKRFGWVEKWPDEWTKEDGKWHIYIAMRAEDQRKGDRYGRTATQYFIEHREELEAGGELLADNYKAKTLPDGTLTVYSAWQVVFNAIADTSYDAFCTEYQNDPPESEEIQTLELTHAHVASCSSKLDRQIKPEWADFVVRGVDMGKTDCWYVDIAFSREATGAVVDYGRFHPFGLSTGSSHEAIEMAMLNALVNFASQDCPYPIDYALVDSGYKTDAIYEACRRIEGNYFPAKGMDSTYRQPKASENCKVFHECHCVLKRDRDGNEVWLFEPNTEYWKNWLQERWVCDPWTGGQRTRGSMALFNAEDVRIHSQFAKSMVSERLEHVPLPGKAFKSVWNVVDRSNNHWLDAGGYACAAASCLGVRLVEEVKPIPIERKQPRKFVNPWGRPFVARRFK